MDEKLIEAIEVALAPFFSGNNMPDMSGDPRRRLSPLQRRNLTDAARACAPLAYRAGMERAETIVRAHLCTPWRTDGITGWRDDEAANAGNEIIAQLAAAIRKEAGEATEGK